MRNYRDSGLRWTGSLSIDSWCVVTGGRLTMCLQRYHHVLAGQNNLIGAISARGMIHKATGLSGLRSSFAHRSGSRVGSAPFSLFPRVILAPVFGGAYSWPTTLFWSNPRQFFQALVYF